MMKFLTHHTAAKLSSALSFLGNMILPRRSSMAAPATELTAPEADPANMTLNISDRAAVSMSGTASSSGQLPELSTWPAANIALALINIKLIHDMKLPGSTPTLPEGVLAAAAGIGLLASAPAIYLQVKNRRSVLAKVLSQVSVISLGCSMLVNLSTRFGFQQFGLVNIVATSGLFLFIVGMVIHVG